MGERNIETILAEIQRVFARIGEAELAGFEEYVIKAPRVFVAGAGRSGLMARAFAMRLMHLGKRVFFVGDVTSPSVVSGDLLIVASGSGETESLVAISRKAKKLGAKLATITIYPQANIGSMADCVIKIDAPTAKSNMKTAGVSIQPMGSLFEQSLLLILDYVILDIMSKTGITSEQMFMNHANLE
jgi:6-phospho-3-hexuloisomerase